jgi:hypothetical protein
MVFDDALLDADWIRLLEVSVTGTDTASAGDGSSANPAEIVGRE